MTDQDNLAVELDRLRSVLVGLESIGTPDGTRATAG